MTRVERLARSVKSALAEENIEQAIAACERVMRKGIPKPKAPNPKAAKKAAKRVSDRAEYEKVRERDAGMCTAQLAASVLGECGGALQIDHQWGRGKEPTRAENCRLLCLEHHRRKTDGEPSRLMWLNDYREHAIQHDYYAEAAKAEGQIALERAQHPGARHG